MTQNGWDELLNETQKKENLFDGWFIALSAPSPDGKVFPEGRRVEAVSSDEAYYSFMNRKESYN